MVSTTLVGILNLTPDSFSDGGMYKTVHDAHAHVLRMVAEGARVIDIGAESTRPGATPITAEEEWRRLEPLLTLLMRTEILALISVDTRHSETAQRALALGVDWINDVSGCTSEMIDVVRSSSCRLVVMHSLTVPASREHVLPEDADPVTAVRTWFQKKREELQREGITADRIVFDPGIGFGKTAAQSLELIRRADELRIPGTALMFGHSRKSFLSPQNNLPIAERDEATCIVSAFLAEKGIEYLRVHNVAANAKAIARQ